MRYALQVMWRCFRQAARYFATSKAGIEATRRLLLVENEIRSATLALRLKSCGTDVAFRYPLRIEFPENVEIGNRVSIGPYFHVWGVDRVSIGNNVMIGSHVAISSVTHDYTVENMFDTVVAAPVCIEDDVWIGTHAVILPGVTVGKGAVVAAACVVTKNVPARGIFVGVPGRLMKSRPEASEGGEPHYGDQSA